MAAHRLLELMVDESEGSEESDSADEDYCPLSKKVDKGEEKAEHATKAKRSVRKRLTRKRFGGRSASSRQLKTRSDLKRGINPIRSDSNIDEERGFILSLPHEVLSTIFSIISSQVGVIPFLNKVSSVCRSWREVARSPLLWRTVVLQGDPTPSTDKALRWLADTHSSDVKHLNLIRCKTLTRQGVAVVQKYLSGNLQTFVIDSCSQVRGSDIADLTNRMPQVRYFASRGQPLLVRQATHLGALLLKDDSPLAHLELNICTDLLQILHKAATLQKPLVLLQLQSLTLTAEQLFDRSILLAFQSSCPNMRELELQFPTTERNFRYWTGPPEERVPGFPHLRLLSVGYRVETCFGQLDDFQWEADFVFDLVAGSPELKSLSLKGLCYIPVPVLCSSVSPQLESLSLSRMDFNEVMPHLLAHFYKLKSLALHIPQGERSACISDQVLVYLTQSSVADSLERISLTKSDITDRGLSELLQSCPSLCYLNLETCRGLSRGLKQKFSGKDVEILRSKLNALNPTNSTH